MCWCFRLVHEKPRLVGACLLASFVIPCPQLTSDRDPVAFISPPRSLPRSFLAAAVPDLVVTVTRSGVLGVHSWLPTDRHSPRGFSFEVDPSVSNAKYVTLAYMRGLALGRTDCTLISVPRT